ncbi:hypothetical protein IBT49_10340 [Erwinia sp. S63]|uniref:hypothetical protein n=1 Tax=Erwinia sp. S63 TaxID=2769341 RepID=UPI00190B85A1|nr:hypothetical protein [Erwinia sp. S63]MBK0096376.1 hypothetical protein [Erwinia sp. S63]
MSQVLLLCPIHCADQVTLIGFASLKLLVLYAVSLVLKLMLFFIVLQKRFFMEIWATDD